MKFLSQKGLDDDSWVDDQGRTLVAGLQVILYLRAGTDSAQPIRVVRDSCVKLREEYQRDQSCYVTLRFRNLLWGVDNKSNLCQTYR